MEKNSEHQSEHDILNRRVHELDSALGEVRTSLDRLEREVAMLRTDFERTRMETERLAGAKLP